MLYFIKPCSCLECNLSTNIHNNESSLPCQINSLSTRVSDKNATRTKRMLCCKCLKWSKNVHSLAAIKYVLQVPYFYSRVSLWPHTFRSFRKRNLGENIDNQGVQGEDKKKNQATVPTYLNTYNTKVYTYITVLQTSLSQT